MILLYKLHINPQKKAIALTESFLYPRAFIEIIVEVLFEDFKVDSIYLFLGNTMPIYSSGMDTGMVVNCGFLKTQVTPIVWSRFNVEGVEIIPIGAINVEHNLRDMLCKDDNEGIETVGTAVVEDIKARSLKILSHK